MVRTGALAALIEEHDAEGFRELRTSAGALGIELRADQELGDGARPEADADAVARWSIELAARGLQVALQRIEPNLERIRERLASAKTIRLIGGFASLVLSSGVVGAILGNQPSVAMMAAVLNCGAAGATLLAQHREAAPHGGKRNLIEMFEELARDTSRAERLLEQLELARLALPARETLDALMAEANGVAADLREKERLLWGTRPGREAAGRRATLAPAGA